MDPKIWIPLCLIDYFIITVFKFVFVSHCASFLVCFLSFVFLLSCSSLMSVQAAKVQWSLREKVGSPAALRVRRNTGKGGSVCVCVFACTCMSFQQKMVLVLPIILSQ